MANLFSRISALFKPQAATAATPAVPADQATAAEKKLDMADQATTGTADDQAALRNLFLGDYQDLPDFVDGLFFQWMAGQEADNVQRDESFEHKIIDYLEVLAQSESAGANLVPRVPTVMVQLLKRSHEENVTGSELSQLITKDVVLVAAILNEVNSSFYKSNKKVTELSQAIMMLGHNRLRMVLAKISFTPVFNDQLGNYTKLAAAKLWDESQQRALACYMLAKHHQVDPFLAFLAGLMRDVGVIVALRVFDRSGTDTVLPISTEFRLGFQHKSLVLSGRIGQIWTLPEKVVAAIEAQLPGSANVTGMAAVLQRADFISKTCMLVNAGMLNLDNARMQDILTDSENDCLAALLSGKVSVANLM